MPTPSSPRHGSTHLLAVLFAGVPGLLAAGSARADVEVVVLQDTQHEVCSYDSTDGLPCASFAGPAYLRGDAADLDGDGYSDIVTYGYDGGTDVQVCFNDADGSGATTCSNLGLGRTQGLNLADYDGDGDIDILSSQFKTINVCENDGSGSFSCSNRYVNNDSTYSYAPYKVFKGLEVTDLNGDAWPDVVAAGDNAFNKYGWDDIACLGDAAGGLTCSVVYADDRETVDVDALDIDLDGDMDLVYTDQWTSAGNQLSQVRVCENDGTGTAFTCTVLNQIDRVTRMHEYGGATVADFDGDGIQDLFLASRGYESSSASHAAYSEVCFGDGAGGFDCVGQFATGVPVGAYSYVGAAKAPEAVDLDSDGDIDLVMAGGKFPGFGTTGAFWCLNDGTGSFTCDEFGTADDAMYSVLVGAFTAPGGGAASTDGDGVCDTTDVDDTDGDGVADDCDAFPSDATETVDTDGDGVGDNADAFPADATESADSDGDGVGDNADAFPTDATETVDTDGDGVGDNADAFPTDATESEDADGDGVGNNSDTCAGYDDLLDADGDLVADGCDACQGDDATGDTDGDLFCDDADAFPADASEWVDTDGDGVGDNGDLFPNDPNETGDADGDGVGDNADLCEGFPNDDTDADGVCDTSDVCPTDATDTDDDNDGVCDVVDVCVGTDNVDTDGDQVCDSLDLCAGNDATGDEDGDAICDGSDNCPNDANADQADADADDIGDACEADTDNDGTIDDDDNCPLDANADQSDLDLDGLGDVCDDDDDDDGVTDASDNCPFYDNADQADLDGDGYGDVCDGDDDADGVADDADLCPGTPLNAVFDSTGCSGPQRIEAECGEPEDYGWWRRGRYVACVAREGHSAWRSGLITRWQKARLIRQAAIDVWVSYIRRIRRWC